MGESLNFCLTFESGPASVISGFSRRLSLGLATDYVLGPEALPHVTILKLNVPPSQAMEIWHKLQPALPARLTLRFDGLRLMPGRSGGLWIEISVARSAELMLLQEIASRYLAGHGVRTEVGDLWRPHVTLLHSVDGRLPADLALDKSLLLAEDIIATPALGCDLAPGMLTEVLQRPGL